MAKYLKLAACMAIIQIAVFVLTFLLILLAPECYIANSSMGHYAECTDRLQILINIPFITFVFLPPLIVKYGAKLFKRKYTWDKVIKSHLMALFFLFIVWFIYVIATLPPRAA